VIIFFATSLATLDYLAAISFFILGGLIILDFPIP